MKAATLRSFMAVHTWVGIATGMLLFIAFYAGALTVFHEALEQWEQPVAPVPAAVDPARAQTLVDAVLRAHPDAAREFRLTLGAEAGESAALTWRSQAQGGEARFRTVELGPGDALHEAPEHGGFAAMVYSLHFTAGIPAPWGTYLFGIVCVLYGIALVSGVVIHAPVLLRDLFALRPGKNLKRFWQDGHNLAGLLSLPFHIIFAWTGAVLAIGTLMLAPFQFFVFDGKLLGMIGTEVGLATPGPPAKVAAPLLSVQAALAVAQQQVPGLEPIRLHVENAGDARGAITVEGRVLQQRMSERAAVTLSGADGSVQRVVDPSHASTGQTFLHGLYALHFADYGGTPLRWLYFVLGLVGAFVFFSGNLLWIESRRRHREPVQRHVCVRMAQLSLGVSLGCIAGIAAMALATRLTSAAQVRVEMTAVYWPVFGVVLLWAFTLSPARGAVSLLWLAAGLHAAIAVADLVLAPSAWMAHAATNAGALAFALLFAWMARATTRRGDGGDPNSVWARAAPVAA